MIVLEVFDFKPLRHKNTKYLIYIWTIIYDKENRI